MNTQQLIVLVGTITIITHFVLTFSIAVVNKWFRKSGRVALLWTSIYLLFLSTFTILRYLNLVSQSEVRIIGSIAIIITFVSLLFHLLLYRKIDNQDIEFNMESEKEDRKIKVKTEQTIQLKK